MKIDQDNMMKIQHLYCMEGLSARKIADNLSLNRDQVRWITANQGWKKGSMSIDKIKHKKLEKPVKFQDNGVRRTKGEWPADARFDRPGMVHTFKVKYI